jgi:hypothetical protein
MPAATARRTRLAAGPLAGLLLVAAALLPGSVSAEPPKDGEVRASLDGKPIPLGDVGRHYCHDFAYPEIRCFSSAAGLEASTADALALESPGDGMMAASGAPYVTIYDYTFYQGSYMHLSEDYWALSLIGWNDRVSSFIGRNWESGAFWTDWFYGGPRYYFCCNWAVSSLGVYDNAFSSVLRY